MHTYYLLNRPDVQPSGYTAKEVWSPTKRVLGSGRWAHGWAEYAELLPFELVWKFDLFPADPEELERYWAWRDEEGK